MLVLASPCRTTYLEKLCHESAQDKPELVHTRRSVTLKFSIWTAGAIGSHKRPTRGEWRSGTGIIPELKSSVCVSYISWPRRTTNRWHGRGNILTVQSCSAFSSRGSYSRDKGTIDRTFGGACISWNMWEYKIFEKNGDPTVHRRLTTESWTFCKYVSWSRNEDLEKLDPRCMEGWFDTWWSIQLEQ